MILAANEEGLMDCATEMPVEEEVKPTPVAEPVQDPVEEPVSPTEPPVESVPQPTGERSGRKPKGPKPTDPNQGVLPLIWTTVKDTLLKFYDESNKE